MCKFHKELARDIATNPATGRFDPTAYSITLVALARYWIDRYMPEMSDCDGYSNYAMASKAGVAAFSKSGLNRDIGAIEKYKAANIGMLRFVLNDMIARNKIDLKSLNLPKNPVRNPAFLDNAMVAIYEGDPSVELNLRDKAENPLHEPLRRAVENLFETKGIEPVLREMQEGSFAQLFAEARRKVNPTLLSAYERLPKGLTGAFKACAMCAGTGTGGALVSHAGCVLVPVFAGASGSAMSAQLMSMMFVTSPVLSAGVTAGIDKLQQKAFSPLKTGASAALGLAIATGVNAYSGHDHRDHQKHHMAATDVQAQNWLDHLNPKERRDFRRLAEATHRTEIEAAKTICGGSNPQKSTETTQIQSLRMEA